MLKEVVRTVLVIVLVIFVFWVNMMKGTLGFDVEKISVENVIITASFFIVCIVIHIIFKILVKNRDK